MELRPFRFGLQVFGATTRAAWQDQARQAEDLGFDTIVVPDHVLTPGPFSPMAALDALAQVTTRLRIGTLVLNNDFRHPALLAREAATLDLLSDGRLELGVGAGHAAPEYAELGVSFDDAATRVRRLGESVRILRRLFDGETVTTDGPSYTLHGHELFPKRSPRLLVGGNGDGVLRIAARYADIVGFTGFGRTFPDGQRHDVEWRPDQIDAKVQVLRRAAGDRVGDLELNVLVQEILITDQRHRAIDESARRVGCDPELLRRSPYALFGASSEIVEQLHRARERWGFSYFVTRNAEATATIIDAARDAAYSDPSAR